MAEVENPGNLYHGNQGEFQHNGDDSRQYGYYILNGDHYHFDSGSSDVIRKKHRKDDPHGWPNAFLRKYKIGTIIAFAILLCAVGLGVGLGVGLTLKSARSRKSALLVTNPWL